MLRECVEHVLLNYEIAKSANFSGHPLAGFVRNDFRDIVYKIIGDSDRYMVKGSVGQGNWARGPWLAVFDKLVTSGAHSGYYPVYLFREDMRGVYLSLNQGMTVVKDEYKSDAKTALKARAGNYLALLGGRVAGFSEVMIDLAPSTPANDTAFYEAGNICAKYYPVDNLPSEAILIEDLTSMIKIYRELVDGGSGGGAPLDNEGDEPPDLHYEDATRFRFHKRIERNGKLAKAAKKALGYACQVCGINFEGAYGEIGKDYIEAHHLKPLAMLKGQKIAMDPKADFAVLCSNCHRMVHRSGCIDDMEKFKMEHYRGE